VKVSCLDGSDEKVSKTLRGYSHNDVTTFTVTFNRAAKDPLEIAGVLPTPDMPSIVIDTEDKLTLSWPAISGAAGYNVYRQASDEPYPVLPGTVPTTVLPAYVDPTFDPEKQYLYAVAAVGTDPANRDTDSDGLKDGEERNYGTIPAGVSSVTITVSPVNDRIKEGSETVSLTLAAGWDYKIGEPDSATVTILDHSRGQVLPCRSQAGKEDLTPNVQACGCSRLRQTINSGPL
jgi:hypothetical protein